MFRVFETFKKIEEKQQQRYYQNFLKKGLTEEEAEQKSNKKIRMDKLIRYIFLAYILLSVIAGIFGSKP